MIALTTELVGLKERSHASRVTALLVFLLHLNGGPIREIYTCLGFGCFRRGVSQSVLLPNMDGVIFDFEFKFGRFICEVAT